MKTFYQVGKECVNWYINTFRKSESYDQSIEMFHQHIGDAMEENNIEDDLTSDQFLELIKGVSDQFKDPDILLYEDLIGPLQTHLVSVIEEKGYEFGEDFSNKAIKILES